MDQSHIVTMINGEVIVRNVDFIPWALKSYDISVTTRSGNAESLIEWTEWRRGGGGAIRQTFGHSKLKTTTFEYLHCNG